MTATDMNPTQSDMPISGKPVILCVDDDRDTRRALCEQLRANFGNDYQIQSVASAAAALTTIHTLISHNIDIPLVLSADVIDSDAHGVDDVLESSTGSSASSTSLVQDVTTSSGIVSSGIVSSKVASSGRALIRRLHDTLPDTLTILLTQPEQAAHVSARLSDLTDVDEMRLYRYMVKPWEPTDLRITVGQALRSFVQARELRDQQASLEIANKDLQTLIRAYDRFVPDEFLAYLGKTSITDVQLGDQVAQEMTILFSDIRDFTSLSEKMTPQENFNFINGYLSQMQPFISKYHGFIDKYIGDAIMALFPTHPNDALDAAIGMLTSLGEYNEGRPKRERIRIGIGLHTGATMLGTVGGENRMDSTVIGDAVNLSSRVEGLTKVYGASLLITEQTMQGLRDPNAYAMRELDQVKVKGKRKPITVYEVFETDEYDLKVRKEASLEYFAKGLELYREQKYTDARAMFYEVLQLNPKDKAAQLYRTESSKSSVYGRLWNE
ncbi:MAG: adenylate/guanylate cyclase domain-containing protein [Deinococcota bacterium]